MLSTRVIPILLLSGYDLIKTTQFKNPIYIGDPINAVRIFNDLEVDELFLIDIYATKNKYINYDLLQAISNEAFIPLCYGGGIKNLDEMERLFKIGIEKISLNSASIINPKIISDAANIFGRQSIVVSIDIKKDIFGNYAIYTNNGKRKMSISPEKWIKEAENLGAGEIVINNIDQDGMMNGYDIQLLQKLSSCVYIPVVGCGGAGNLNHIKEAMQETNVSGLAAGSMFVFYNKLKGVLINYPGRDDLEGMLEDD